MISEFEIKEVTCLSCNNELLKQLGTLQGVFGAKINRTNGKIMVTHTDEVAREQLFEKLHSMGLNVE